jgi:hypothetical protein
LVLEVISTVSFELGTPYFLKNAFIVPLRLGNAEIGNWNISAYHNRQPIRSLSGCVDEFLLFSRALRDQEIEQLYTHGRRRSSLGPPLPSGERGERRPPSLASAISCLSL